MSTRQSQASKDLEARLRSTAVNFSAGNMTAAELAERLEELVSKARKVAADETPGTK